MAHWANVSDAGLLPVNAVVGAGDSVAGYRKVVIQGGHKIAMSWTPTAMAVIRSGYRFCSISELWMNSQLASTA